MIKTVRKIALISHCRGREGRRETEREGKLHLRAYFICCHHCDSCPVSKWENLIYNSLLCLLKGLKERQQERGDMPWVSCLGRNEKCCWKIWELERSTSKEENVKHVYCHSLYSRELLRKVMKHFYTRLQQHFPAILLQSTLLRVPLPLPLLPLASGTLDMFLLLGQRKTGELTVMRAKKNCALPSQLEWK